MLRVVAAEIPRARLPSGNSRFPRDAEHALPARHRLGLQSGSTWTESVMGSTIENRPLIVAGIGATGADAPALEGVLAGLPEDGALAVLVVPYAGAGDGFEELRSAWPVVRGHAGDAIEPGKVYLVTHDQPM